MLNKAFLMGRITKDPELRYTQSGIAVCTFSIAVDRNYSKTREQRQTDFINIVAWRKTAEFIGKYFAKGRMIVVVGNIQTRTWEDQTSRKHYVTEIIADEVFFGDSKKDGGAPSYFPASPVAAPVNAAYAAPAAVPAAETYDISADTLEPPPDMDDQEFIPIDTDDDLPF